MEEYFDQENYQEKKQTQKHEVNYSHLAVFIIVVLGAICLVIRAYWINIKLNRKSPINFTSASAWLLLTLFLFAIPIKNGRPILSIVKPKTIYIEKD